MLATDDGCLALPEDATDGLAAIELAAVQQPDAVILDMEMPGMNELAATEIAILAAEGPRRDVLVLRRALGVT